MTIHQILAGLAEGDAISSEALQLRAEHQPLPLEAGLEAELNRMIRALEA